MEEGYAIIFNWLSAETARYFISLLILPFEHILNTNFADSVLGHADDHWFSVFVVEIDAANGAFEPGVFVFHVIWWNTFYDIANIRKHIKRKKEIQVWKELNKELFLRKVNFNCFGLWTFDGALSKCGWLGLVILFLKHWILIKIKVRCGKINFGSRPTAVSQTMSSSTIDFSGSGAMFPWIRLLSTSLSTPGWAADWEGSTVFCLIRCSFWGSCRVRGRYGKDPS